MEELVSDLSPKPNPFTTVTPFSKSLALILFITLPFLGFYLGVHYQTLSSGLTPSITNTGPIATTKTGNNPSDLPATKTGTPTSNEKIYTLKTPAQSDWVKYQAQCPALLNSIEIFYPKTWFPKEFPNVLDYADPTNAGGVKDCQVIFGYLETPEGYQARGKELATIRISTWIDKVETLEDYIKSALEDPKKHNYPGPSGSVTMVLNNRSFVALENDAPDLAGAPPYELYTKVGDRFFRIAPIEKRGTLFNQTISDHSYDLVRFDASAEAISKEFLNRLKIL